MSWLGNVLIKTIVNGLALWLAAAIVPGIHLGEQGSTVQNITTIFFVALIFGLVNAVLKPILRILSLPFVILTLGLFLLVVNALLLELTSWLAGNLNLAFHVDSFWWDAIWGALIVSVVASILNAVIPDPKPAHR